MYDRENVAFSNIKCCRRVCKVKFSEIEQEQWDELKPYLDTCLLPITGMSGAESPVEATRCLEDLRDIMDLIEIPYQGRVVTYPALHYMDGLEHSQHAIDGYCQRLKQQGFKYIILITAKVNFQLPIHSADLWISPQENGGLPSESDINAMIRNLWRS